MVKISTLYNNYQELMFDLSVYGKILENSLVSEDELRSSLFEELKLTKPLPTLEDKRYELSDLVSNDYAVSLRDDIELLENEKLVDLGKKESTARGGIDNIVVPPDLRARCAYGIVTDNVRAELVHEFFSKDENSGRSDENSGRSDENLCRSDENLGRYDENLGRSDENLGRSDENLGCFDENLCCSEENSDCSDENSCCYDSDLHDTEEKDGYESFDGSEDGYSEDEYDYDDPDYSEDEYDSDGSEYSEDEYDSDGSEYSEDEYDSDGSEYSEDEYDSDGSEYSEDEYGLDGSDYSDDEYNSDGSDYSEDEYNSDGSDYSEDEYNYDSSDYSEDEYDSDGYDSFDDSEDWYSEDEYDSDGFDSTSTEVEESVGYDSDYSDVLISDNEYDNDISSGLETQGGTAQEKSSGVPDIGSETANSELVVENADVEVNREDEPKELREFVRKHPRCEISFALKYFPRKEIERYLMLGKLVKKGSKLHI